MDAEQQINEAVEERMVEHATAATRALDQARDKYREAAKHLLASGLPIEIHQRTCLAMEECHAIEALIGEHATGGEQ